MLAVPMAPLALCLLLHAEARHAAEVELVASLCFKVPKCPADTAAAAVLTNRSVQRSALQL
jgi:hypothetical protein